MTHAFSRPNIFSTSQFWCFPFISLTEDISDCPLHLLSQGQTMKKEACTSLQTGFGYEAKLNIRSHALRLFGSLPFIAVNVKGFPPLPAPLFRKWEISQYYPPSLWGLGSIFSSCPTVRQREQHLKTLLVVPFFLSMPLSSIHRLLSCVTALCLSVFLLSHLKSIWKVNIRKKKGTVGKSWKETTLLLS